jgi:hypothetical protein
MKWHGWAIAFLVAMFWWQERRLDDLKKNGLRYLKLMLIFGGGVDDQIRTLDPLDARFASHGHLPRRRLSRDILFCCVGVRPRHRYGPT